MIVTTLLPAFLSSITCLSGVIKNIRISFFACLLLLLRIFEASAQNSKETYPFPLEKNEQVLAIHTQPNKKTAFLLKYDTKAKYTRLKTIVYNSQSDSRLQTVTIDSAKVGNWQNSALKGKVKQSFENAVASGLKPSEHIPLEYQYQVTFAPDGKTVLCYRYDYSQPTLYVKAQLLNASLNWLQQLELPIDDGMINHGVFISNKRDVYLLNTNAEDGIELIQYMVDSGQSNLLEVAASSTRRNSFRVHFFDDDIIYIGNTSERKGSLVGVMYSQFNFAAGRVEEVNYYSFPDTILEKMDSLSTKGSYHITHFTVDKQQQVAIELEKRNILANKYSYDPYAANDLQHWQPRKMQVQTGEKLYFLFDSTGKLLSEKVIMPPSD